MLCPIHRCTEVYITYKYSKRCFRPCYVPIQEGEVALVYLTPLECDPEGPGEIFGVLICRKHTKSGSEGSNVIGPGQLGNLKHPIFAMNGLGASRRVRAFLHCFSQHDNDTRIGDKISILPPYPQPTDQPINNARGRRPTDITVPFN